jgi:hypothetical protein
MATTLDYLELNRAEYAPGMSGPCKRLVFGEDFNTWGGSLATNLETVNQLLNLTDGQLLFGRTGLSLNKAAIHGDVVVGSDGLAAIQDNAVTQAMIDADNQIVHYGVTSPTPPFEGQLWVDMTQTPYALKVYYSGAWVDNPAVVADGSITEIKLADNSVSNAKMQDNSVNTTELVDNAVTNAKMADDSINTAEIINGAVTNAKLAALSVDTGNLIANSVTNAKLALLSVDTGNIIADAVTNAKLALLAVDTGNIVNAAVTGAKIASATITTTNIAAATITGSNIAATTITNANITAATITGASIAAATIAQSNLANNSVGTNQILDANVTGAKIAPVTITSSNIAAGTIAVDRLALTVSQPLAISTNNIALSANTTNDGGTIVKQSSYSTTNQIGHIALAGTIKATHGTAAQPTASFTHTGSSIPLVLTSNSNFALDVTASAYRGASIIGGGGYSLLAESTSNDTESAILVKKSHVSATGNIAEFYNNTGIVAKVTKAGTVNTSSKYTINDVDALSLVTANPSAVSNARVTRTNINSKQVDLSSDGSSWFSQRYYLSLAYQPALAVLPLAATTGVVSRQSLPDNDYPIYIEYFTTRYNVNTTLDNTNKWTIGLYRKDSAGANTSLGTYDTYQGGRLANTEYPAKITVNASYTLANIYELYTDATKSAAPGNISVSPGVICFRLIIS